MTFVTLRDLNTDNTVLGQDWQELRENFEYLKTPPLIFVTNPGTYIVSGAAWQDTDPIELKFTLTTDGGPVVVSYGCVVQGNGVANTLWLRVLVGGSAGGIYAKSRIYSSADYENIGRSVPWVLAAGNYEISLQHYLESGSSRILYPYVAAKEF